MQKGWLKDKSASLPQKNVSQILKLAKQSHENYIVRSSEKDLENALSYYARVIEIDPLNLEVCCKRASLMWEKGQIDVDTALKECKKALEINPHSSVARLYSGYFLKISGRFDEAEEEFLAAIKINRFCCAKPRIALSINIIQKMSATTPSCKEALRALHYFCSGALMILWDINAIRLLCRSVFEDISNLYLRVNGSFHKRFKNYEQAIEIYMNAAERTGKTMFYSEIGDLSIETGDTKRAVEYYKKFLESNPDNPFLWAKLVKSLESVDEDNVAEIKNCYNRLAELEPENAKVFYELGHLYLKLNDKFSMINAFRRAVELEPDNAYYHNSLAYSLVQLEDYNTAIEEYQKSIKLNPDNTWTSIVAQALGAIYHQVKNNFDAAIVSYQTAVVLDPYNVDAFIALGELYHERGDLSNAIDSYCEALKLDPAIAKVYCNLGAALWERDYAEEAIVAYQKAISIDPHLEMALNNLGVIYLDGLGKPEEAMINFTSAIKCNPNFALAYYNKARTYQALDNKMNAAKFYQLALDINKFTEELDEEDIQDRIFQLFSVD